MMEKIIDRLTQDAETRFRYSGIAS